MLAERTGAFLEECSRPTLEPGIFRWDREVPAEWEAALRSWSPRGDPAGWLELGWAPGTPAEPVQRWAVYEATPANEKTRTFVESYYGIIPPNTADQQRVWRFFQLHGALLQPAWIIQGVDGGHPYRYADAEQQLRQLHNLEPDAPDAGSLAYAEWDGRVERRLREYDRLHRAPRLIAETGEPTLQKALARKYREELVRFWMDYAEGLVGPDATDIGGRAIMEGKFQRVEEEAVPDIDSIEARYVETGVFTNDKRGL